ncbi:MAG TPA: response regulator transcription factor [Roseiflexaceae bacterium]|nr:response regulator transcription factor [Roseiflexaceae bacterium]HMP42062.1 response regulator transcription factor [Roseiflexaceae bacterium]
MVQIVIIAQTPAMRAGLRALLVSDQIAIGGEGPALNAVAEINPVDVVVVAGRELLHAGRPFPTGEARFGLVLLDDDPQAPAIIRQLPVHGWAVLPHDSSAAELQAAVLAAAQGMIALPAALAERMLLPAAPAGMGSTGSETLTTREREVLSLVARGLSNKLIARELNISEHTVKFHISAIFAKLGAVSRTDAISRGAREGLITL